MNIKDLKALIRFSVKQRFLEETRKKHRPLETFDEFNTAVCDALVKEGFDIDSTDDVKHVVFEKVHVAWSNIHCEVDQFSSKVKVDTWNDAITFYVPELVKSLKSTLTHSNFQRATKNVVSSLLR